MNAPNPETLCPRCQKPLTPREIGGIGLEGCAACGGLLVSLTKLNGLLEATSVELLKSFDPDTEIKPLAAETGGVACPRCSRAMESADYCNAKLVAFDRCNRCSLLWLGSEGLGAMTLMWARMEARGARTKAQIADDLSTMDRMADASRLRRRIEAIVFRL
jgi:Zn-finger nucleic acid-binding protein